MTIAGAAPASAITWAIPVSPGTGACTTRRVTASSVTVTSIAHRVRPPAKTATAAPSATTAIPSQMNPLRAM
jgi:hypothetical protein